MQWNSTLTSLLQGVAWSVGGELLGGLPLLCLEEKAALDSELTLEELTEAVNQMASSRAPGINGLSREFFLDISGTS